MSSQSTPERSTRRDRDHARDFARRRRLPWRRVFVAYAAALTVGTHWPRLRFGAEIPTSDTMLHAAAFATATFLLWQTGWIRRRLLVAITVLAWAGFDELTQGVPGLGRVVSGDDMAANALGILVAASGLWATRPLRGTITRDRHALHRLAWDMLFARGRTWLLFGAVSFACAMPVVAVWPFTSAAVTRRTIIIAGLVAVCVTMTLLVRLLGDARLSAARDRRCFHCGTSARAVDFGLDGTASCPACGVLLRSAQWHDPPRPAFRLARRLVGGPLLGLLVTVVLVFLVLDLSGHLYAVLIDLPWARGPVTRVARFLGTRSPEISRATDLAAALVLVAITVNSYRRRLARFDEQGERCRVCGHDLRGTPCPGGLGRCGECGTAFRGSSDVG